MGCWISSGPSEIPWSTRRLLPSALIGQEKYQTYPKLMPRLRMKVNHVIWFCMFRLNMPETPCWSSTCKCWISHSMTFDLAVNSCILRS